MEHSCMRSAASVAASRAAVYVVAMQHLSGAEPCQGDVSIRFPPFGACPTRRVHEASAVKLSTAELSRCVFLVCLLLLAMIGGPRRMQFKGVPDPQVSARDAEWMAQVPKARGGPALRPLPDRRSDRRGARHHRGRYQGAPALSRAAQQEGDPLRRGGRRRGLWLDRHVRASPARRNGRTGIRRPR